MDNFDKNGNAFAERVEYPLTAYQKDIWLEQSVYSGKPLYNIGAYLEINDEIDYDSLQKSIDTLFKTNDALRIKIIEKDGQAYQCFLPDVKYKVPFLDFSGRENAHEYGMNWMNNEFIKPFNILEDVLLRFALIKTGIRKYLFFIVTHHIITDGLSYVLILTQITDNYNKAVQGIPLEETGVSSFRNVIEDNIKYLGSSAFVNDKEYWKEKLIVLPEQLVSRKPKDRADRENSATSSRLTLIIKREMYNRIIEFSKENGCSTFHYFLGILFLYFSRVYSKDTIAIGMPVLNRGKAEFKKVIGLFASMIPLVMQVDGNTTFIELMNNIKNELRESYRHQKLPIGEILKAIQIEGEEWKNLFEIVLSYENLGFDLYFGNTKTECVPLTHQHETRALSVFVREYDIQHDVRVNFDYQMEIFDKNFPIENVVSHIEHLINEVMDNSGKKIADITVIDNREKEKLLYEFNNTKLMTPSEDTIYELFEKQVEKTPDHIAIVFQDKRLTYRGLEQKISCVAEMLRENGVANGTIVGIMLERSVEMAVAILGVLKDGGAYLPLDPGYPGERIKYMLEDSGAGVLLARGHMAEKIDFDGKIVDIEDLETYKREGKSLNKVNKADDLAYIIYTSGTTGKPKGVMVEHGSLAKTIQWRRDEYRLGNEDVVLQLFSYAFDGFVTSFFTPLISGSKVVMLKEEEAKDPVAIKNYIANEKITHFICVPVLYSAIIECATPKETESLRIVTLAGDKVNSNIVKMSKEKNPLLEIVNEYGPTEGTVVATCARDLDSDITIGKPVADTSVYILDNHGSIQPIGVYGEICLAGTRLAKGYINRPELTKEKFVENPFEKTQRMYRTGDMGRWLPDGNIAFLGRADHQVKVRGYRIEPGEIEAELLSHPGINEAVVIDRRNEDGSSYLCAYVITDIQLTAEEIREYLEARLPNYMIPAYFIQIEKMPLTPNGKLDRQALPQPSGNITTRFTYEAPRNEAEEKLAKLWQEVLGVEKVGINDSFFSLGGDSIKAIQVSSRLLKYDMSLAVHEVFKRPTIRELAKCIKNNSVSEITQEEIKGEITLTPIQRWFFDNKFTNMHHWNQAVMLYGKNGFGEETVKKVFEKIVMHHDALRMVYRIEENGIIQYNRGANEGTLLSFEAIDCFDYSDEKIEEHANRLQASMNLATGPLVKLCLFRTKQGDHLLIVIHHLVVDGVSWRIILEDFAVGYTQAINNMEIKFQSKTDSYMRYSQKLGEYANSKGILKQKKYWKELVKRQFEHLPTDYASHQNRVRDSKTMQLVINAEQTQSLLKSVNGAYNTEINDILLAALGLSLKEWKGISSVVINLEGHGREAVIGGIDVTRTVGWFTSIYPVLLNTGESENISHTLKSIKESIRQIPAKGIGYQVLKYLTSNSGDMELKPEITFNYLGQFAQDMNTEVFGLSHLPTGNAYDLDSKRSSKIEINGMINDDKLSLGFIYNSNEFKEESIAALLDIYNKKLNKIIEHCIKKDNTEYTPSDYGDKGLSIKELEEIYGVYGNDNIQSIYPLTPMQEGMLFHALEGTQSEAYFAQISFGIKGRLDIDILQESFDMLVQRHDVFRTGIFYKSIARPRQVVLKHLPNKIYLQDISPLEESAKQKYIEEFRKKDRQKGFDLTQESLVRLSVLKIREEEHILVFSTHHIIVDGWCISIIFKELFEFYLADNKTPILEKPPLYKNYIDWLEEQDKEEAGAYWEDYLKGYENSTGIPETNRSKNSFKHERIDIRLSKEKTTRLEEVAKKYQVTLNTLLQTIWGILVQRYNNTDDVVFGAVVAGRPSEIEGIENMIGMFINTLPVRMQVQSSVLFSELLKQIQYETALSQKYAHYPLVEIQMKTAPGDRLINHIVVFENYPFKDLLEGNKPLTIDNIEVLEQSNYNFNLIIIPGNEMGIRFDFNSCIYDRNFVTDIGIHLNVILEQIIENADIRLEDIEILSEAQKRRLLYDFNNTVVQYPENSTIIRLFEEQAEKTPDSIAVVYSDKSLTYRELNEKVNQLARVLIQKGLRPGEIAGIMVERSLEMIIGILGILKSGGAYLPLDPEYPSDRLEYMLNDSGAKLLLTHNRTQNANISLENEVYCINLDDESIYLGDGSNLGTVNSPGDLAYIIYTSGTTGRPKGVMIEHKSISNTIQWRRDEYKLGSQDSILQLFSYSFDGFLTSFFTPIVSGARVMLLEDAKNPLSIASCIASQNITHFISVPVLYSAVLENMKEAESLRVVTLAGDMVTPYVIEKSKRVNPGLELANEYGPTENSVATTILRNMQPDEVITIGRPIANTRVYILDRNGRLQPAGVPGELCISGVGLARGYVNNSELTAQKFVLSPFIEGERMYRTGDAARWLADGSVEFLGRIDQQVKVRGYRIEPGEIEAVLLSYKYIKEAAVIDRQDADGNTYLCAYFVADNTLDIEEVREWMFGVLPDYMLPASLMQIEKIPLTPNGKLDRRALSELEEVYTKYEAPRSETETKLAEIWKSILSVDKVGIHDNFFNIGGHSLKATMLVVRIQKQLNTEISIRQVYNTPTLEGLAQYIDTTAKNAYLSIPAVEEKEYYRVSSEQKRLYILNRLEGARIAYNIPTVMEVHGELDRDRLEKVFEKLIQRHELLRTSFEMLDDEPVQRIHKTVAFKIEYTQEDKDIEEILKGFIQPFDLETAPLMRMKLVNTGTNRHLMLLDIHHIISDGVSVNILMNELARLYEGKELKKIGIQYKDYSVWQHRLYSEGRFASQEEYWTNVFKGELSILNLQTDYPRPSVQSFEGDRIRFEIDSELTGKINEIAKKNEATVFMVLFAAYAALLHKYTGQDDIIVGTTVAGRSHADLQDIMGMFVNTIALRSHPSGNKTFGSLLEEVRENALQAYENQDYQFEELVGKLDTQRDMSRNPLFDTLFALQNIEKTSLEIEGLRFVQKRVPFRIAKFDIGLYAGETENGIAFEMEYCTSLFEKATVERLAGHYVRVLEQIADRGTILLSEIDILSEQEKNEILVDFNNTAAPYPKDKTIHMLFEEQAERTPDETAVVFEDRQLTYRELDERSNQLARVLRDKGVKPDSIVGIMAEHSPELVIGIFGVLKAGGAYLPIDPEYPEERIRFLLEDSGAEILLVSGNPLPQTPSLQIIDLQRECRDVNPMPFTRLEPVNTPDNLAYIIYTSGSTGRPKGVMVTHQGLVNYIWWARKVYLKGERLDFPLYSSISFDLTVTSIFTPLISGCSVIVYGGEDRALLIEKVLKDGRAGIMKLTPTHLRLLEGMETGKAGVRKLIVGGEDLQTALAQRIHDKFDGEIEIYNEYGPTETVVGCMIYKYNPVNDTASSVPVGIPADNARIYLLDAHQKPVPAGVPGEIYISGDCVARGYLNRSELTAEKFIPNPFVSGERMYRTGDIARRLRDGNIEFMGRTDHQVKLRGYRIELGEIESRLLKHPSIREAVVTVSEGSEEDKQLCAYIVGDEQLTVTGLREHLLGELPDYMIPAYFIRLEQMPLTPNGKLDRKALPGSDGSITAGMEYEAPRNETEKQLAEIWQEILDIDKAGINDNFFDLGGHSLKATVLAARIHKKLNCEVPLWQVFRTPTIQGLAQYIRETEESVYQSIQPVEDSEYYEVSSAQKRLYIIDRLGDAGTAYNTPGVMEVEGNLDAERLQRAFEGLIHRHEILRTSFEILDGEPVQKVHDNIQFKIDYAEIHQSEAEKVLAQSIQPFNLGSVPLMRVKLLKTGEDRHLLMLDMHHIICDGVSMDILVCELTELYEGRTLEPLTVRYRDYSAWQNRLFSQGVIKKQQEYWLSRFAGEIPVLDLPTDYPRPSIQSFDGDSVQFGAERELARSLNTLAAETGTTLFMVLLAAYTTLLHKYTRQEDIIVGSPVAGRSHADLQNIMGMFVNTVALRSFPSGNKTMREYLDEVRRDALEAFENQDCQFEELIESLEIPRDMSRNPLFDTMLVLQNADISEFKIEGLKFTQRAVPYKKSKFDIMLNAVETAEGIRFELEYCTALFKKETVCRMAVHFINILEKCAQNIDAAISDIDMLSQEERDMLLHKFNDTGAEYDESVTIHELFEEQAQKTPYSTAAVFGDSRLTYSELNEKSSRLAARLREKGVKAGSIVGMAVHRSLEMMVGVMGILKAGGAYLPISPEYPAERIRYMLEDSGAAVLLTQNEFKHELAKLLPALDILDLNDEGSYAAGGSPGRTCTSGDPAYVIYTSGSTGKPKGAIIEHRSLVNRLNWMQKMYPIGEGDVILQKTTYTFDVSVWELLWWSITGASVCFLAPGGEKDPRQIVEAVERYRVTTMHFVPSMLNVFLEEVEIARMGERSAVLKVEKPFPCLTSLKQVFASGEALTVQQVSRFNRLLGLNGTKLHNLYGPTEATIDVSYFDCSTGEELDIVPIGRPIDNIRLYILGKRNELLPVGIAGELNISGVGLARGYLNKPELTAEKFVPNPFIPGERMYKTGDQVRWLPDGNIEYLGRIDQQVKIRGFRIELGEIESCLLKHSSVREATVIAGEGLDGSKYLCAYFAGDRKLAATELKEYLSAELPDYMLPTYFIQLERLPVTPNGKLNRKALPMPNAEVDTGVKYEAPRNETEERLVKLWREILGVDKLGTNDSFFDRGGHSLKAAALVSKIHKALNVEVPLKQVFITPTVQGLAQYIKETETGIYRSIQPVEDREYYEASPAQRRLYIINCLDGVGTAYNAPIVMEVEGRLDVVRLEQAFVKLIQRHEILRTSFEMLDGRPIQRIHKYFEFKIDYAEAQEDITEKILEEFIRPFDLKIAPLLRVRVLKIGEDRHLMLFDISHIIFDGTSAGILVRELTELYDGRSLEPLRVQYRDYCSWQDVRSKDIITKQEEYWLGVFKNPIPALNMPTDYSRPSEQSFEGDRLEFGISRELSRRLKLKAVENEATLYMVLLAAYTTLLYKYTGQEDIIVGSPIAARPHADLQNMIGMFVNTLAMRNHPSGEKSFAEYLCEVRANALMAYENQDYQFEELVDRLDVLRDMSRNPIFDTMLVLQNLDKAAFEIKGLQFRPKDTPFKVSKFDLTLNAIETDDGIRFNIEYCTSLFSRAFIERLAGHYIRVLEQITDKGTVLLSEIDILSEQEKDEILVGFNNTAVPCSKDKTIDRLFEEQVERTPDSIAVVCGERVLTYRELNERSNCVAGELRAKGVGTDTIVGIMTERSLEMVVGIMGILKAGGAYLPIDPNYPADRIRYMLKDSGAGILLAQNAGAIHELPLQIIYLNEDIYHGDGSNLNKISTPDNLAYVIYTSGSTGKPKGVMVEHGSAVNILQALHRDYPLKESDSYLLKTAYTFDVSVSELFGWFLGGGRLVVLEKGLEKDPEGILEAIEKYGITHINFVPSMLNVFTVLLEKKRPGALNKLKYVFAAGEAITAELARRFMELAGGVRLENLYGPTEATIYATGYPLAELGNGACVPIGKPLSNIKIYITDKHNSLQPVGVPGELCISGVGLARGYLNRLELTEEKFVPCPFETIITHDLLPITPRMYRTGDFARWLPDGNIEFLGRMDQQVKIRGFRIEPGEIESCLLRQESIKEAAVAAIDDKEGNKSLCAYIVSERELSVREFSVSELRGRLSRELPDYMIPLHFIRLEGLPLTPSGKLDRNALPQPDGNVDTGMEYVAPRNQTEQRLVELWQEILGVQRLGINDNFFVLGGHSLKAAVLVSRIHRELNCEVPLSQVFRTPDVKGLAEYIKGSEKSIYQSIQPVGDMEYYELSSAQKRLYIINRMEGAGTAYNMPCVMEVHGRLDAGKLRQTFEKLIHRHESLRTSFEMVDGQPVQKIHNNVEFKMDYAEIPENEAEKILEEFIQPFDLSIAPLMRAKFLKTGEDRHLLLIDIHHIICDGISAGILVRELAGLYEGRALEPLTLRYRDYSSWQNSLFSRGIIKKQEDYWLDSFTGEIPVLNLPTDYPRPSVQSFEGDGIEFAADRELAASLKALAAETGTTLYMVLLAAYTTLLHKYTGQQDIIVGSPTAGRSHADLQNIMGMFVNTIALRSHPSGDKTIKEYLAEIKRNTLEAFESQDYQFEGLIERLDIPRDMSRNPLFDTMLVLQNTGFSEFDIEGLKFIQKGLPNKRAKFDMTLNAVETEEGVLFELEYCTRLFKKETMQRMAAHFINILKAAQNPQTKISEIDMLSPEERDMLLHEFNRTNTECGEEVTIHKLFEEQAEKTPDNTAVVCAGRQLKYSGLNRKSNHLARVLKAKGVKPGSIIAILAAPSLEMITGIMAVLKAGAAYLPIDPAYPADRIKFMLEDSGAEALLTCRDRVSTPLWDEGKTPSLRIIYIDDEALYVGDGSNLENISTPTDLAYIIYTSGTTGVPKGVMVEHRSLVNLCIWHNECFGVTEQDRATKYASFGFDASVFEMFPYLVAGASLYMLEDEIRLDIVRLKEYIEANKITICFLPTQVCEQFMELGDTSLRILNAGGDKLKQYIPRGYKVFNHYGPAENTVVSTCFEVDGSYGNIPIGRPIRGTQAYILGDNYVLQPVGVPGELCVSGVGLARGYLNRPELTAEKFVPNPFAPGERMYRTGDLARWLPDGNIEFLGRMDRQIKIRGHRIELGEIEARLLSHGQVREAVVTDREDANGSRYLCAYIVAEERLTEAQIREYLSAGLPAYMIPPYLMQLESMPLTPNGKIDVKALPEPEEGAAPGTEYQAPRDEMEEKLVAMWQEVLGVERVGINNSFFELGGDSLKLIRLAALIHGKLKIKVSIEEMMKNQTIASIAAVVKERYEQMLKIERILSQIEGMGKK